MCAGPVFRRPSPPPPPPPAPVSAPTAYADPESNKIVSGSQKRKRAQAGAAVRRGTIMTGSRGVLGEANIGKTLLGS